MSREFAYDEDTFQVDQVTLDGFILDTDTTTPRGTYVSVEEEEPEDICRTLLLAESAIRIWEGR